MIDLPGTPLTEAQRRPLIDDDGRRLLGALLEHDHAPRFNHTCGDRLTERALGAVQRFDAEVLAGPPTPADGRAPWVDEFATRCLAGVPVYRRLGLDAAATRFEDIPTTDRTELVRRPWSFVPDDHPLDEMVVYTTTGTSTGQVAYIASTPETASSYAVMLRAALATCGLTLDGGPGRVAVALVCWQQSTYTYASVSSFLGQGAVLKLNLNPTEWNDSADVARYLDHLDPEVFTGDPVAFAHLAELPLTVRPKALLSTAMALTDGLRARLEERFGCPVIDIYGTNEAGPIAASPAAGSPHVLLQPRLHVELLDPHGHAVPAGERGEVTLTGGFNPAFPLLRYRTGDHAALVDGALVDFVGRAPVAFLTADDRAVNTIDLTVALQPFALARYRVHQRADLGVVVGIEAPDPVDADSVRAALARVFGAVEVTVEDMAGEPESVGFTSDLAS